jgi:hypothetical protein
MDIYIYTLATAVSVGFGLVTGYFWGVFDITKALTEGKEYTPLDRLKNALLTFAMMTTNKDDIAHIDLNYDKYNGDKFPALSGSSFPHACYTYIFNRRDFRGSLMYSKHCEYKLDAIEKYLNKQFSAEDRVLDFFIRFCEKAMDAKKD